MSVRGRNADPFWATSAVNLLWLGVAALRNLEAERFVHLDNLRALLNRLGTRASGSHDAFMARHLSDQVLAEYRAFMAQDTKVLSSVLATVWTWGMRYQSAPGHRPGQKARAGRGSAASDRRE